ncbi:hypothetical protein BXA15_07430 [Campylobacter lari]|uniref:hypothetical protein n=1 Tax=Campylobacter lari TaxID=201 RepID=UPI001793615F|nr:hypothetical protein [Campylobacter lari]EAI3897342.1 hypothetical protein [Campylobacter lari]EAJ5697285.1 hypothetical protein [Campylobacter lari]EHC7929709.1 hypothetical protein [Campylobacter lari]MCR2078872.1 hypothetical protein [Campylobacter lari subsp. concheus]MCR6520637.1 hypothetical protein [Campylobacter lari]
MIDKKYRTPKYFLRAKYPQNANDIGYVECYQAWFLYGTTFVHKYVELLHKQLIRKGRAVKTRIYHPLFPNSYGIDFYDIKSPSRAPYNYHNSGDLGLNQFFVGQNPYEWYRGDPGDKSGIYHDTCQIIRKRQNLSLFSFDFHGKNVVTNPSYLLKYKEELKNFYYLYNRITFDKLHGFYNALLLVGKVYDKDAGKYILIFEKPKYIFVKSNIINNELIKPNFILPDKDKFKPSLVESEDGRYYNLRPYYDEFLRLNKNVFIVPEKISNIDFLSAFNNNINVSKLGDIFHPLAFLSNLNNIAYQEPVVLRSQNSLFNKNISLMPCYNNESNMPYGRKDRWFILWDSMYDLYVKEDKEWWEFIIAPVVSAVIVFISFYTGGVIGGALGGMIGGASATIITNITIALSTLGGVIDALSFLGIVDKGSSLSKINKALKLVLAVAGLVSAGYKIGVDINTAISNQTPIVDVLINKDATSLDIIGYISDIFLSSNLKEASLPLDENSDIDEHVFFGEASKEDIEMVTKNLLNENWYSFDTLDILNEKDVEI